MKVTCPKCKKVEAQILAKSRIESYSFLQLSESQIQKIRDYVGDNSRCAEFLVCGSCGYIKTK